MEILVNLIGPILGALATILSITLYYRDNKRIKTGQADNIELKNLTAVIEQLKKENVRLGEVTKQNSKEITALKEALGVKDVELINIESENNKRTRAMNCQSLCEIKAPECPILKKWKELGGSL